MTPNTCAVSCAGVAGNAVNAKLAEAIALLFSAFLFAGPVPARLVAARWTRRAPAAGLVVWQTVGLLGGLSLLAAELTIMAHRQDGSWPRAVARSVARPADLDLGGLLGGTALIVTGLWLLGVLATSAFRVARGRRRHRNLLDLFSVPAPTAVPSDVRVLQHAVAAAYSIPGRPGQIVVSTGICDRFTPDALRAVVEHERAHLRQHHDIVIQPFVAWQRSFPFLSTARAARHQVEQLTEYLADDAACRAVGAPALRAALIVMDGPLLEDRRIRLDEHTTAARQHVMSHRDSHQSSDHVDDAGIDPQWPNG